MKVRPNSVDISTAGKGSSNFLCGKRCKFHGGYKLAIYSELYCILTRAKVLLDEDRPYYRRNVRCLKFRRA